MELTFNAVDIFDMVVDEQLTKPHLQAIADRLYADKRGGLLAHLWSSEEFLNSLNKQLWGN